MTDKEMQMYGCDIEAFKARVKDSVTYELAGGAMIIAGLMSDAQELMSMNDTERARQFLNQAKALLFDMMDCDIKNTNLSFFPERK
tara:strand:+ start:285 stop:542 length:258 start_codon:yes stop_codon:yes gene_type:complete